MTDRDEALRPVVEWLHEHNDGLGEIPRDLDLIENRVIDSLAFMDFVLLIEDLSGRELDLSRHTLDEFRTLDAIFGAFLEPAARAAADS